ncbi:hypothetical protein AVEN_271824-1 [Araneus ventricosus]|uniref:Uncharacterized protein n=1 Tax=Araneus ventricosus TaxID=182803 RepID=A0A4Y2VIN0_ARAVE|nr:hypothetical protein AVEN_271824-1 [Araneus ventricosus]
MSQWNGTQKSDFKKTWMYQWNGDTEILQEDLDASQWNGDTGDFRNLDVSQEIRHRDYFKRLGCPAQVEMKRGTQRVNSEDLDVSQWNGEHKK